MKLSTSTFKLLLLFLPLLPTAAYPQNITLRFPAFAGQDWDLLLFRGQEQDTVLSGAIPSDGEVALRIPEAHRGYTGMARWMLRQGGGLDMVINGEDFSVECLSDQPNDDNIIYSGSAENAFLRENYREQERLLLQYEALRMVLRSYPPGHPLYAAATEEEANLQKDWAAFRSALSASPLYAARFRQIVDVTRGVGSRLGMSEAELAADIEGYLSRRMSWEALYRSNHWSGVIFSWVQLHTKVIGSDTALLSSARRILARLPNAEMYTSFCDYLARSLSGAGKDHLIGELAAEVKGSGKLLRTDGMLAQYGAPQAGELAPELGFIKHLGDPAEHNHQTVVLRPVELSENYSLLVFYQSGCGPCENLMPQLVGSYPVLAKKGVRLISISADTDYQVFENTALGHPWADKYCDERGMSGPNFRRYGVVGTPTMFLLDAEGRILLRTASWEAVWQALAAG
ncbi:peroxiredoxin family protein [Phaeodactylibacter luteus]|uniref:Redoxin domain-containing protein n=1 Tax=Phaeodactylibacter luteus TaxID=1564516 RepID=A0A5C6RIZ4_9BACT|nr:thioredoxin family protein [Phaeodactylibacter luteus]TXB61322.1 redoxin domain-containing protein [Phaeodactylibacter luteus]